MTNRQRQDAQARMQRAARQPHAHNPMACNPGQCQTCYGTPGDAVHILPLPGMESADSDRANASAAAHGDELTAKMLEPIRDISVTAFIGIDGLRKIAEDSGELDFIRHEPQPDKHCVIVSRAGELHTGECTDQEAQQKRRKSSVWRTHSEKMMRATAERQALESAFPEWKTIVQNWTK